MKRSINNKNNILDSPVPNTKIKYFPSGSKLKPLKSKLIKLFPETLKPTKYVPPQSETPTQKPRTKRPVPMPRSSLYPKPIADKIKKLIDEITPIINLKLYVSFKKF